MESFWTIWRVSCDVFGTILCGNHRSLSPRPKILGYLKNNMGPTYPFDADFLGHCHQPRMNILRISHLGLRKLSFHLCFFHLVCGWGGRIRKQSKSRSVQQKVIEFSIYGHLKLRRETCLLWNVVFPVTVEGNFVTLVSNFGTPNALLGWTCPRFA